MIQGKKRLKSIGNEATLEAFFSRVFPYLLLLFASFIPFAIYFRSGMDFPSGDDSLWHRIWAWDLAEGWKNGFFGITPSHTLMGNLGLGTYLFYGGLSHEMVALLHVIFPFLSINWSWKILTVSMTYLMGIWMYWLGKKLCKNDLCALMLALCLIFSPYRINCVLYRAAYPEAFALSFAPLLFLGVYNLGHGDFRPQSFLSCVFGVSCMVLCHPFTSMSFIIAALIYLLLNYKGLLPAFHNKQAIILTACSVVLVFCLISFYFFPMMHYKNSGLYNISDNQLMWINAEHLAWSTGYSDQFSGFLRPDWIEHLVPEQYHFPNISGESWLSWVLDYVNFGFFGALGVFLLCFLGKKNRPFLGAYLSAGVSLFCLCLTKRAEMFLIAPIFSIALFLIGTSKEEKWDREMARREIEEETKDPSFYWLLVLFVACFILMFVGDVWYSMPSLFYTAQFAWRFWGLTLFLAVIIVALATRPFAQKKYVQGGLAMLFALSFLSCMGPIDKRFVSYSGQNGGPEPSISLVQSTKKQGSQNEYVPMVFRQSDYRSEYSASLYPTIRKQIYGNSPYRWGMENYLTPAFLEGSGSLTITSLHSPEATFDVVISSDTALVQLPQFYYEGYEMVLSGDSSYQVKGIYVDGLVSFNLKKGAYQASLKWVGLTSYRVGVPLFFVGLVGCVALYVVPTAWNYRHKKEEKEGEKAA